MSTEEVKKAEVFFSKIEKPKSIQLDAMTFIENVDRFIESHLEMVKSNQDNIVFEPYLDRLRRLAIKLKTLRDG